MTSAASHTTAIPSVAGARIMLMRQILQERHPAELQQGLTTLPVEIREEFINATSLSWVNATTDHAVHDAVAAALSREPVTFHEEILREAMERSFKTLWRILLRLTSDEALVARTPTIFSRTRNVGEMTSRLVSPGHGECIVRNYPGITARDARNLCVGLEVILTGTGRKDVRIQHVKTDDGAIYTLTWTH